MRRFLTIIVAVAVLAQPATANGATKTVRYGPFTVSAAMEDMPTMLTKLKLGVARPCLSCYITGFVPNLTYADGTTANYETMAMLHHAVFTSQFRSDATCGGTLLGLAGERFFATGNERTVITLPPGYGYRVNWWDSWNLYVDLMNMAPMSQTFYVDVTFSYRSIWESVKAVKPIWLDIDQCGDSEYSIPATYPDVTEAHSDWHVNVPGRLVAMAGHLHDYGVRIEATKEPSGQTICTSTAGYDASGHVNHMSTCSGDPLALLHRGDVVRIHSIYSSPIALDDVMGIMLGYIHPAEG